MNKVLEIMRADPWVPRLEERSSLVQKPAGENVLGKPGLLSPRTNGSPVGGEGSGHAGHWRALQATVSFLAIIFSDGKPFNAFEWRSDLI